MLVGNARGFDTAWVADDNLRAFLFGLQHPASHDRMRIGTVVTDDQQAFGVFDIANRVAHRAVAQRGLQTRYRRAMTDAGAAVDVVGADDRTGKLLHHVVGFVAGAA
ncbi:hypothetical protein D3C75_819540 [compost metagenome]